MLKYNLNFFSFFLIQILFIDAILIILRNQIKKKSINNMSMLFLCSLLIPLSIQTINKFPDLWPQFVDSWMYNEDIIN